MFFGKHSALGIEEQRGYGQTEAAPNMLNIKVLSSTSFIVFILSEGER